MMDGTLLSVLIVNIIGFLTLIVSNISAARKASAERKEAADILERKYRIDSEIAERNRKWSQEDRSLIEARATLTAENSAAKAQENVEHLGKMIGDFAERANTVNQKIADIGLKVNDDKPLDPHEPEGTKAPKA